MPTIDNWRALREALEAGPTEGPLEFGSYAGQEIRIGQRGKSKHEAIAAMQGRAQVPWDLNDDSRQAFIDAGYFVAADPTTIRSLLDERDRLADEVEALRADAGRWRYALTCVRIAQHGDFLVSPDDPTGIEHSIAGASFVREVDAAMNGKP